MRIHRAPFQTPLILLLACGGLQAQVTTGTLSGRVTTKVDKPVQGAVITLESPALFQPRLFTTDASGTWRANLLPVGNYKVKLSAKGHHARTAEVRVGVGTNQSVNLVTQAVEVVEASVDVTAQADSVQEAKASDKLTVNFDSATLSQLPAMRTINDVVRLTPGASTGRDERSASVRGSESNQVNFRVDGIDVKDDRYGQTFYQPVQDSIEDMQVVLTGTDVRLGRSTGGAVTVVTKSGSNTFEGSMRAYMNRNSWYGDVPGALAFENANAIFNISRKYELTLSGPVVKDRLWFAMSGKTEPTQRNNKRMAALNGAYTYGFPLISGNPVIDQALKTLPSGYSVTSRDASQFLEKTQDNYHVDLKLTGALTPDHRLVLSATQEMYQDDTSSKYGYDWPTSIDKALWPTQERERNGLTVNWLGVLTPSLLVDASYSVSEALRRDVTTAYAPTPVWARVSNGDPADLRQSATVGMFTHPFSPQDERRQNKNLKVDFTQQASWRGDHTLVFGFEVYSSLSNPGTRLGPLNRQVFVGGWAQDPTKGNGVNPASYLFPAINFTGSTSLAQGYYDTTTNRYGPAPVMAESLYDSLDQVNRTRSLYIQDAWTINNHWTVSLGLRHERSTIADSDPTQRQLGQSSFLAPRFSLSWDPTGTSKDVVRLSFARSPSSFTTKFTSDFAADPTKVLVYRGWAMAGQPDPLKDPANAVRWVTYDQLTDPANYGNTFRYKDTTQTVKLDKLAVPYSDDLTLNYRRGFENGFMSISVVQRDYHDEWFFNLQDGFWANYQLVKDPTGRGGAPIWQPKVRYGNSPDLRRYQSVEVSWKETISSRFYWMGGYSWSRTRQRSKADGQYFEDFQSIKEANGITRDMNTPWYWTMPTHIFNIQTVFQQPLGKGYVSFALNANFQTGGYEDFAAAQRLDYTNVSKNDTVNNPNGYGTVGITPYWMMHFWQPGSFRYYNDWFKVDARVNWEVPLGWRQVRLVGGIYVTDLLHNVRKNNSGGYTTAFLSGLTSFFPDRRIFRGSNTPGYNLGSGLQGTQYADDYRWGVRNVVDFNIGLKF